jgi:hypothetical protein
MRKQILITAFGVALASVAPASADVITNGTLTLVTNPGGSINDVSNAAGGFWNYGYPTIGFGIKNDTTGGFGGEDENVGRHEFGGSTASTATTITATGSFGNLSYTRTYSFSSQFDLLIETVLSNTGLSPETFKFFDTGDPDQGVPRGGGNSSFNDITSGYAIATNSSGVPPDLVKFTNVDADSVLTFTPFGLDIFDPGQVDALFAAPYDPNLADQDIGVAIIWERTLGAGESTTLTYIQSYGTAAQVLPEPATMSLFGLGALAVGYARRRRA